MQSATGRWVTGDNFFDRTGELEILAARVRGRNHVLLSGQRRMGKTSMLRELGAGRGGARAHRDGHSGRNRPCPGQAGCFAERPACAHEVERDREDIGQGQRRAARGRADSLAGRRPGRLPRGGLEARSGGRRALRRRWLGRSGVGMGAGARMGTRPAPEKRRASPPEAVP